MTETIWIVLIVATLIAVVVLIVFALRKQDISKVTVGSKKVTAQIETREKEAVTLNNVKQKGEGNHLEVARGSTHIEKFEQDGKHQRTNIK